MTRSPLPNSPIPSPAPLARREPSRHALIGSSSRQPLARYSDAAGRPREVLVSRAARGSVLVLDRDAVTHGDARLLAHLCRDEPRENAARVVADYLRDEHVERRRCRLATREDARVAPPGESRPLRAEVRDRLIGTDVVDRCGQRYRLAHVEGRLSIPELRWTKAATTDEPARVPVSMREVIARAEAYEPIRAITIAAVSQAAQEEAVSATTLRAELARVLDSPIVLNRALRSAVCERVARGEMSMSEIAIRCGRTKRDGRGNVSGETSWLARRLGLLAEGGLARPTPWIHIEVLALIARDGLGICPREVEV